jgi:hypothetical protein
MERRRESKGLQCLLVKGRVGFHGGRNAQVRGATDARVIHEHESKAADGESGDVGPNGRDASKTMDENHGRSVLAYDASRKGHALREGRREDERIMRMKHGAHGP